MSAVPPLYNMGGSSYKPGVPRVLWSGIDTLECWYPGGVRGYWRDHLEWAKQRARKRDVPEPVIAGRVRWGVDRKGLKPWAYLLRSPDVHLRVGTGKAGFSVRCLSLGLAARGADALLAEAERSMLVMGEFSESRVSRVDLAVDFQGHVPALEEMTQAVCSASFRPVYPSITAPETYQFGRGAIVARVYNKTVEVARGGSHWPGVWRESGCWDANDGDVWRVEFQYRSDALRDFGIRTTDDLRGAVESLWRKGFEWLSVRQQSNDSNHRRWPVAPWWASLADAYAHAEPLERCRDEHAYTHATAYVPQASGLLVSIAAHLGIHDPAEAMRWLLRAMGEYHCDKLTDFEALVIERQLELFGVSTSDGLEPVYAHIGL